MTNNVKQAKNCGASAARSGAAIESVRTVATKLANVAIRAGAAGTTSSAVDLHA